MGKKDLKADLMELLREDTDLRQIIREICNSKTVERFSSRDSRGITDYLPNWLEKSKTVYNIDEINYQLYHRGHKPLTNWRKSKV